MIWNWTFNRETPGPMGRGRFSERVESNWEVSLIYIIHPYMGIVTIARAGPESTQNLSGHVPSSGHPLSIQHREWGVCSSFWRKQRTVVGLAKQESHSNG